METNREDRIPKSKYEFPVQELASILELIDQGYIVASVNHFCRNQKYALTLEREGDKRLFSFDLAFPLFLSPDKDTEQLKRFIQLKLIPAEQPVS